MLFRSTLCFHGRHFADHALDVEALREICRFQEMVKKTAELLWEKNNPGHANLPSNFHNCTRLCLHPGRIEEDSALVPLFRTEITPREEEAANQPSVLQDVRGEYTTLDESVSYIYQVIRRVNNKQTLADAYPPEILKDYSRFGESLSEEGELSFAPRGETMERVNSETRARLAEYVAVPRQGAVDITGEILGEDVQNGLFHIWYDEKAKIAVEFTEEQQSDISTALKEHRSLHLRVLGQGEFNSQGNLEKIMQVDMLDIIPGQKLKPNRNSPHITDVILNIFKDVPDEVWKQIPSDLSHNHDYYLRNDEQ